MNKCQRIVLVLGAIILLLVIANAPTVQYSRGGSVLLGGTFDDLANVIDLKTAIVRGLGVIIATILIFFAFKSSGKGRNIYEESKKEVISDEPEQKRAFLKRIKKFFSS